ncbi:unnamed protein product [Rotaria sp. Silwood1]|nr:unnamed protein product [Rotaria sp. Silwood1]CAF1588776.1 unnamed protein product [Rotaria sp. Silwood1]
MVTPELLSSSMNFISFPSHITTSRDNQENISTWCISEEIKEYNLDNVEFERDELFDDPCYNNEKMPEGNQFKEDIQYEDPVVHCQNSQDQFEQILRQFHKINHKLDDIYEYLSSDRIINIIQRHSGRSLLHAELNGSTTLSSTTASNLISRPTNFRHLVSICREQNLHHHPAIDDDSSSTNPNTILPTSPTYISGSTNNIHSSNSTMMQIHSDSSNNQNSSHNLYTNQSTLATPNLNRLQTLT